MGNIYTTNGGGRAYDPEYTGAFIDYGTGTAKRTHYSGYGESRFDLEPPPSWMDQANCLGLTPEESTRLFFNNHRPADATKMCGDCPVQTDCLAFGLNEPFGVYGGLTAGERRGLTVAAA